MEDKLYDHSGAGKQIHLHNFPPQPSTTLYVPGYIQAYFNNSSFPIMSLTVARLPLLPSLILRSVRDEVHPPFSSSHFSEDTQIACHNQYEISHRERL